MNGDRLPCDARGFALLTVLWLVTALSLVVGLSMGAARTGSQTTTNRLVLARSRWAAEACLAIVQARWGQHRLADSGAVGLGRGTRCSWTVDDPSTRVNLNVADREVLETLGFSAMFVEALLERRRFGPLDDVDQAAELPGFDSTLTPLVTVAGTGTVNLASASRRVLLALPGLSSEAADRILYRRATRRPLESLAALAADLSPTAREHLMTRYDDLRQLASFAAPQLVLCANGWVEGYRPRAVIELTVVPLPERLAVVARRMW